MTSSRKTAFVEYMTKEVGPTKQTKTQPRPSFAERKAAAEERSRQRKARRIQRAEIRSRCFGKLAITPDGQLRNVKTREGGPVAGATARVETSGEMQSRYTVTRLATFGVLGLGMKKKTDDRKRWLTIEGDGYGWVIEVQQYREGDARKFAAKINGAAAAAAAAAPESTGDVTEQLSKLSALHTNGVLTDDEFTSKKKSFWLGSNVLRRGGQRATTTRQVS